MCYLVKKNTHQLSRHRSSAYLYVECYLLRPRQPFASRKSVVGVRDLTEVIRENRGDGETARSVGDVLSGCFCFL